MSESVPGGYYCRSEELSPLPRADLFNPDGSLTAIGLMELARISRMYAIEYKLALEGLESFLGQWKHRQWEKLQEPSDLSSPAPIDYLRFRENN